MFSGTDRISLRKMSLKPHEWSFKFQEWASGPLRLRITWDLQGSKLEGLVMSENQGSIPSVKIVPHSESVQEQGAYKVLPYEMGVLLTLQKHRKN